MARQAELAAAHDAEQARLTAALNEVRQAQTDGAAASAVSSRSSRKQLHQALEERAAVTKRNAAEIEGAHRSARGAHAHQRRSGPRGSRSTRAERTLKSEATELAGRHGRRSRPTSTCCGRNTTCCRSRRARAAPSARPCGPSSKKASADVAQAQADVQVLKDALNEAMAEQGRLAETVGAHEGRRHRAQATPCTELGRCRPHGRRAGKAADLESQLGAARQEMEGLAQSRRLAEAALNARIGSLER